MGRKRRKGPKEKSPNAEQGDLLEDAGMTDGDARSDAPAPEPPSATPAREPVTPEPSEPPESPDRPEAPEPSGPTPEAPAMTPESSDDTPERSSPSSPSREVQMELPPEVAREVEKLEAAGALERALDVVNAALVGHEASAPLLLKKVTLLGSLGRFEVAMEPLRTLRLLEPDAPRVRLAAGMLLFRRGLYEEAERDFRAASFREDIPEKIREQAQYYLAESLNRLERLDEALEILHGAVDAWPSERAFQLLGRLYDRKGSPEEANVMYRIARELDR